jgi:RNA polymerase sigma-70 factor (ECF subfamily)
MDHLTALLLDRASVEVVGVTTKYGPEAARRTVLHGLLYGSERIATPMPVAESRRVGPSRQR